MEKEKDKLHLPIEPLFPGFLNHISKENNARVIFSAKFGTGKTYFLKHFFEQHKDEFEVFYLFPVNYHVASSEDIFDLIKFDILSILQHNHGSSISDSDFNTILSMFTALKLAVSNNMDDFIKNVFSYIPKIGKPLSETYLLIKRISESFKSNLCRKKSMISDYKSFFHSKEIAKCFDTDPVTVLLKDTIEKVKGSKQSVLIIDDLDRVDPAHIFRILNVLSAHFDLTGSIESNKLGFDKVIIVCDFTNLIQFYKHRYGQSCDYKGYFDKFYSEGVFRFDMQRIVRESLMSIFAKYTSSDSEMKSYLEGEDSTLMRNIEMILTRFIEIDKSINLREIVKFIDIPNDFLQQPHPKGKGNEYHEEFLPILNLSLKILKQLMSFSTNELIDKLEEVYTATLEGKFKEALQLDRKEYLDDIMIAFLHKVSPKTDLNASGWKRIQNGSIMTELQNQKIIISQKRSDKCKGDTSELFFFGTLIEYLQSGFFD